MHLARDARMLFLGGTTVLAPVMTNTEADTDDTVQAAAPTADRPSRRERRRQAKADRPKHPRRITIRVVLFLILVLAVLGAAGVAVGLYARGTYYVGFDRDQVAIYQGRPGGLLWFEPTVKRHAGITKAEVPPSRVDEIQSGKEEPTVIAAQHYIDNLNQERTATTIPITPSTSVP